MYEYCVSMKFGKTVRQSKYHLPEWKHYFRVECVVTSRSPEQAISVAYARAGELLRSGFEVILVSCERMGKTE